MVGVNMQKEREKEELTKSLKREKKGQEEMMKGRNG